MIDAKISYSDDIVVQVRDGRDVVVELSAQGPSGPQGPMGEITPELDQARDDAVAAAAAALASKNVAAGSAADALASKNAAAGSATAAAGFASTATTAKNDAVAAKTAAQNSATSAADSATAAATSKTNAASSATAAAGSASAAQTAKTAAQTAATNAGNSEIAAAASEDNASQSATDAAASAASIIGDAEAAAQSAADAEAARDEANAAKTATLTARDAATTAASTATSAKTDAETARTAAQNARTDAIAAKAAAEDARDEILGSVDAAETAQTSAEAAAAAAQASADEASQFDPDNFIAKSANGSDFSDPAQVRANLGVEATLEIPSQAEAEAGTATVGRKWTAQRVAQTITALAAAKNHTQAISTVTGLQAALDAKAPLSSPALTGTPTAPTPATADSSTKIATTAYVRAAVDDIINGAPGALDTLNELAAAMGDDPNFAATVTNELAQKADLGHVHAIADVTGLQAALNAKLAATAQAVDSAKLGGQLPAYYLNAANLTGTVADARLTARLGVVAATITDWNDATTNGWYKGNAAANGPDQSVVGTNWVAGRVDSYAPAYAVQTVWGISAAGSAGNTKAMRRACVNGVWQDWYKVMISQAEMDARYAALVHTHAIADVTGLQAALNAKAPLASPALTGTPTAPTAAVNDNTTKIATTAFVKTAVDNGVNGLQGSIDAKANTADVYSKTATDGLLVQKLAATAQAVDSAKLNGQLPAYYLSAANLNAGTISDARLPLRLGAYCQSIANGDWNNADTNGWFMGANVANAPGGSAAWFLGQVIAHNTLWCSQLVWAFSTNSETAPQIWRREKNNGNWEAWQQVMTTVAEQDARYLGITAQASDSAKLAGLAPLAGVAGDTIAQRTAQGYLHATYFYNSHAAMAISDASEFYVGRGDNFIRKTTLAGLKTSLALAVADVAGLQGALDAKLNRSGDSSLVGSFSTSGQLEAGRGSGSVALTTNDGGGNANVAFNHKNASPDANGSSARITAAVDGATGSLAFQVGDNTVAGQGLGLPTVLRLYSGSAYFDKPLSLVGDPSSPLHAATKQYVDALPITKEYVSAEQVLTANGLYTLAHGLGVRPKLVEVTWVCKTAEYGYSVGDELIINTGSNSTAGSTGIVSLRVDNTNIRLVFNAMYSIRPDNNAAQRLTDANWNMVVRAYA